MWKVGLACFWQQNIRWDSIVAKLFPWLHGLNQAYILSEAKHGVSIRMDRVSERSVFDDGWQKEKQHSVLIWFQRTSLAQPLEISWSGRGMETLHKHIPSVGDGSLMMVGGGEYLTAVSLIGVH